MVQSDGQQDGDRRTGAAPQPCRALIADRSLAFAEGIAVLLRSARIDAQATSLDNLVDVCWADFTVLVVDGDDEEQIGESVLAGATDWNYRCGVVVLVGDDPRQRTRLVAPTRGVRWLSRHVEPTVLIETVIALHERRPVGRHDVRRSAAVASGDGSPLLTDRELAVLHLLAQAQSNKAISDSLEISPNTVRTHIRNVLLKLNAHSRAEAVAIAVRWGVLNGQQPGSEWAAG